MLFAEVCGGLRKFGKGVAEVVQSPIGIYITSARVLRRFAEVCGSIEYGSHPYGSRRLSTTTFR